MRKRSDDGFASDQYRSRRRVEHHLRSDLGALFDEHAMLPDSRCGDFGRRIQCFCAERDILHQLVGQRGDVVPNFVHPWILRPPKLVWMLPRSTEPSAN